jgi:pilus assembly protein CpaC
MRFHLFILLVALILPAVILVGQTAPPREMNLIVGRGELLQFDADIKTVAASEPKIADAVVVSPREVMVNAKGVGKTTVVVWETGALPRRYLVNVSADNSEFERARQSVVDSLSGLGIQVTGNAETMVLTGDAKSVEDSRRAEALTSMHTKRVVNLVRVPDPPEPPQILLEVKFASVDRTAMEEVGFNFFSRNDRMLGALSTQQFQAPRFSQLQFQDQDFSNSTVNFADLLNIFLFRPDLNIGATIKALQGRNLLQILAEPNLIAVEGKEASFLAGGEFPFPTLTATSTGGAVAPVVTVQFKKFGIQLGFTPKLTPTGAVHLKVRPEVSALDFANAVTLQGFLIPAVSTRQAETEVILRDGETFAIAGLLDNRLIESMNKIKWLGDVPIIGVLFRSRSTKKSADELLVTVTPHFVRPLPPGEKPVMPEIIKPYLPPASEDKGAGAPKKKGEQSQAREPEQIGPYGHQEPRKN